nr:DNA directed RNA polymerase alpha subunit [Halimeda borneensis]
MVVALQKKDVFKTMQEANFYCISSRVEKLGKLYGCFKIGPFSENESLTFANALRRTLLSQSNFLIPERDHTIIGSEQKMKSPSATLRATLIPCVAVQIYGIEHEFSTLRGIRESVLDIMANLEAIRFQITQPLTKPKVAFLNFYGPGIIQAKHIHLPSGFKCVQPSQYIATSEVDGKLIFKLFFSIFAVKEWQGSKLLFFQNSPSIVEKVNYTIQSGTFIFFEVWTNGSIHPQKAILNSINKLLLEIFPYSQKISKIGYLTKKSLNEKFLNLEISNFYFNLETFLFCKKKKSIELLIF